MLTASDYTTSSTTGICYNFVPRLSQCYREGHYFPLNSKYHGLGESRIVKMTQNVYVEHFNFFFRVKDTQVRLTTADVPVVRYISTRQCWTARACQAVTAIDKHGKTA